MRSEIDDHVVYDSICLLKSDMPGRKAQIKQITVHTLGTLLAGPHVAIGSFRKTNQ